MLESNVNIEKMMLKEISGQKVLSREDEKALFIEYETASPRRKEKIKIQLINANMRFVLQVALSYTKKMSVELSDLVSEGKLGLLTAVDLFDHNTNNKFISFAVWHIKCKISKFLENRDLIRLPSHQKVLLNKAKKESAYDDVDDHIRYLWDVTQSPLSFDTPSGDNEYTLSDIIKDESYQSPEHAHYRESIIKFIEDLIGETLDYEEIEVLSTLYGLENNEITTLRGSCEIVGKSHERIRQIRDKALKKLRRNNKLKDIRDIFYDIL